MTNQELARFLEDHRKHVLEDVGDDELAGVVGHAHDRATTRALLAFVSGNTVTMAVANTGGRPIEVTAPPSRQIKPGSKRAKDRAAKAGITRANNLAKKRAEEAASKPDGFQTGKVANDPDAAPLSPATHLAVVPGGGTA